MKMFARQRYAHEDKRIKGPNHKKPNLSACCSIEGRTESVSNHTTGGGRGLSLIWSRRVRAAEQVNRGWFSQS